MVNGRLEVSVGEIEAVDRKIRHIKPRLVASPIGRSYLHRSQEKLLRVEATVTVLKLTQVGGASSLRRSGECWLRNSAKWPRKFAIRGASGVTAGGHSKSAPATVYQKHRSLLTRKWMYRD